MPAGWADRLVLVSNANTRFVRGWCLEVHDLAIAKLAAGRQKDIDFLAALHSHRMAQAGTLTERLAVAPVREELRLLMAARIDRYFS